MDRYKIERALGIIEGVSYTVERKQGEALVDAIEIIDMALKEEAEE